MRVLLTGASGFLGRAIQAAGGDFVPFSRATGGDVRDADAVRAAMAGCDAVIHAAGVVAYDGDPERLYDVHVRGTENVLRAAAEVGARVVHVSTSGTVALSDGPEVIAEDGPSVMALVQRWPYYRTKLTAERRALDVGAVCLNPSLLLGPGDTGAVVRDFLDGAVPAVPPGGLSFADVRDVAATCLTALTRGAPGERHLLGACNLTFRAFYERLARISGKPAPRIVLPGVARAALRWVRAPVDVEMACHHWWLDDSKARATLGWAPRDPGETLRDAVEDAQSRRIRGR